MQQETPLDADPVGDPPHGEDLLDPAAPAADYRALEDLYPLAVSLHHLGVHLHGVARSEAGDLQVLALALRVKEVDDVRHCSKGYHCTLGKARIRD